MTNTSHNWDVFLSHASEDKEAFVKPLANALEASGLRVWYDQFTLTVGDSLRRSIDEGLARSRFGVVVISPDFLSKEWPQIELDGLVQRELDGTKVILPVWHRVTADEVRNHSPTLAGKLAISSDDGLEMVTDELLRAIGAEKSASTQAPATPVRSKVRGRLSGDKCKELADLLRRANDISQTLFDTGCHDRASLAAARPIEDEIHTWLVNNVDGWAVAKFTVARPVSEVRTGMSVMNSIVYQRLAGKVQALSTIMEDLCR